MTPVVNGLEANFGKQVDFRALDAASGEGQRAFAAFNLPCHPSYVLIDPSGEILWRSFGPLLEETLSEAIEGVLDR